jgi:hypothetical protein
VPEVVFLVWRRQAAERFAWSEANLTLPRLAYLDSQAGSQAMDPEQSRGPICSSLKT